MSNPALVQTSPAQVRRELADRLRQIRVIRYGEQGGPVLASQLGIPARSWANFEAGVTIPGEVLLAFIHLTTSEPRWLLDGSGARFRPLGDGPAAAPVEAGPDGPR